MLLTQRYDYFKALLTGAQKEANLKQVTLQEDTSIAIQALFSFFKNEPVTLTEDTVFEILTIANKYGVEPLKNICEQWMLKQADLLAQRDELWPLIC